MSALFRLALLAALTTALLFPLHISGQQHGRLVRAGRVPGKPLQSKPVVLRSPYDAAKQLESNRPMNLFYAKQAIIAYKTSGQWADDQNLLLAQWLAFFNGRSPVGKKDAVVFDVDDTVLSTYSEMIAQDFGYIPKLNNKSVTAAAYPPIAETQMLYNQLLNLGYKIIFLTGRRDYNLAPTKLNLQRANFPAYEMLIVRSPSQYNLTALDFKSGMRAQLVAQGYSIIGTIGDQWSDIDGNNSGYRMKVVNPCYFIQ